MENKEKCSVCKEWFDLSEMYEYRGIIACEKHFDEAIKKRDFERAEVMATTDASVRSQSGGEWWNGGYKTMKTDLSGTPIPSKVKEPQRLKEYEGRV